VNDVELDGLVDDVLFISRGLFGVSIRSITAVSPEITVLQYRTLVVLASRGPQKLSALRMELGTQAPAVTRLCNRLVERGLVERHRAGPGAREVEIRITASGAVLISEVLEARRLELARVVARIPPESRQLVRRALQRLGEAIGEPQTLVWAQELVT
jgi:DNA-binding MarR family transcriptional regulator